MPAGTVRQWNTPKLPVAGPSLPFPVRRAWFDLDAQYVGRLAQGGLDLSGSGRPGRIRIPDRSTHPEEAPPSRPVNRLTSMSTTCSTRRASSTPSIPANTPRTGNRDHRHPGRSRRPADTADPDTEGVADQQLFQRGLRQAEPQRTPAEAPRWLGRRPPAAPPGGRPRISAWTEPLTIPSARACAGSDGFDRGHYLGRMTGGSRVVGLGEVGAFQRVGFVEHRQRVPAGRR